MQCRRGGSNIIHVYSDQTAITVLEIGGSLVQASKETPLCVLKQDLILMAKYAALNDCMVWCTVRLRVKGSLALDLLGWGGGALHLNVVTFIHGVQWVSWLSVINWVLKGC